MTMIATFTSKHGDEVEIDLTNRRIRQSKPGRDGATWRAGEWNTFDTIDVPIGSGPTNTFRGGTVKEVHWGRLKFAGIRHEDVSVSEKEAAAKRAAERLAGYELRWEDGRVEAYRNGDKLKVHRWYPVAPGESAILIGYQDHQGSSEPFTDFNLFTADAYHSGTVLAEITIPDEYELKLVDGVLVGFKNGVECHRPHPGPHWQGVQPGGYELAQVSGSTYFITPPIKDNATILATITIEEPEPDPGPMRSDVIIRQAAETAAQIFAQQGWAVGFDAEDIELALLDGVDQAAEIRGDGPRGIVTGYSGRIPKLGLVRCNEQYALVVYLDTIEPEDFDTEA